MPLHDIENVSKNRRMAIYRITESVEELMDNLSPDLSDKKLLESFSNIQKRREWLAGRITLRHLAKEYNLPYHGVRKDGHGKPYLRNHKVEISLSHSFPYVAAIIDPDKDVGIDLEQPKEKLHRIAPRFLNTEELDNAGNDIRKLCILWCAKEALYKICNTRGVIFRDHMAIMPFDRKTSGVLLSTVRYNSMDKAYEIKYEDREDFLIAFNQ